MYDVLDVDSLLEVLSFMSAQGLARLAAGSRLGAVVSHEAQQHPALLVLKGTVDEVSAGIRESLAARPTMAFLQYTREDSTSEKAKEMLEFIRKRLPPECEVMGGCTQSVQACWFPDSHVAPPSQGKPNNPSKPSTVLDTCDEDDSNGHIGLLLATLPEARTRAFHIRGSFMQRVGSQEVDSEDDEDTCSDEDEDDETEEERSREAGRQGYPGSDTTAKSKEGGYPSPTTTPKTKAEGAKSDPLAALLALDPPPKVIAMDVASGDQSLLARVQQAFPQAAIIGGVVMGGEVLVRGRCGTSSGKGTAVLAISGNVPLFAMTCPMITSYDQSQEHVRQKMRLTQEKALAEDQKILGAVLFTCCGRGPSCFGREANDAFLFRERFPQAPLLGYYAGGEIGPAVPRVAKEESAFLVGNARHQGYTAVYGIFLVPRKQTPSMLFQRAVLYGEVQEAFRQLHAP